MEPNWNSNASQAAAVNTADIPGPWVGNGTAINACWALSSATTP